MPGFIILDSGPAFGVLGRDLQVTAHMVLTSSFTYSGDSIARS
jgi:hypothetical protein